MRRPSWDGLLQGEELAPRATSLRGSRGSHRCPRPPPAHARARAAGIDGSSATRRRRGRRPRAASTSSSRRERQAARHSLQPAGARANRGRPEDGVRSTSIRRRRSPRTRRARSPSSRCRACGRRSTTGTPSERRWQIRKWANVILTNPDMLHVGVLPHHDRWADVFANLRYVVVDEAHVYRGVFGSHVANVLRRLRRLARSTARRRSSCSRRRRSATQASWRALAGVDVDRRRRGRAPRAERTIVLWNPPLVDEELGQRASALGEASRLLAALVERGLRTICFAKSRRAAELVHRFAAERLDAATARTPLAVPRRVHTRSAPRDRASPGRGRAAGRTATDALELGIDIGLLDCAISVGFPGTVASLRQQWGRAGRRQPGWRCSSRATTRSTSLHARTGGAPRPARRGGDPRPREPARPRRPRAAPRPSRRRSTRDDAATSAPALERARCCRELERRRPATSGRPRLPGRGISLRSAGADSFAVVETRPAPSSARSSARAPTRRCTTARSTSTSASRTGCSSSTCGARGARRAVRGRLVHAGQTRRRPRSRSRGESGGSARPRFGRVSVTEQVVGYQRTRSATADARPPARPAARRRSTPRPCGLPARQLDRLERCRSCSARCTPPSTRSSRCCRSWRCATAGTSAACRRTSTTRRVGRRSSSTTATPAASASRTRLRASTAGSLTRRACSRAARAQPGARRACSPRSAATERAPRQGRSAPWLLERMLAVVSIPTARRSSIRCKATKEASVQYMALIYADEEGLGHALRRRAQGSVRRSYGALSARGGGGRRARGRERARARRETRRRCASATTRRSSPTARTPR